MVKLGMVQRCLIHSSQLFTMMLLLIFALFLHSCSAGDPCPPKKQLAPCRCTEVPVARPARQQEQVLTATTEVVSSTSPTTTSTSNLRRRSMSNELHVRGNDTFYTIVDCNNPKSIEVLAGAVSSALDRMLVDQLNVSNVPPTKEHTLTRLPSRWLRKVRVRSFKILNSKLVGNFIWRDRSFEGQERSLIWFAANNCSLTGSLTYNQAGTVHTQGLNFMPSIQVVDLSNNFLTDVHVMAFRFPPTNLTTVILSRNSIESVQGGAFFQTPLLRHVDLSHNLLESITRNVFASPANNLEYINLSWNSLTTLPADFFNNMPALKTVDVSHNFLYTLAEKPWAPVWENLTYIDVTGNFVGCDCQLMWLVDILSPAEVNGTSTAAPRAWNDQVVRGICSKITQPGAIASNYELTTLTRDRLGC